MIGYEGVSLNDFSMYFSGSVVWYHLPDPGVVIPCYLEFPDRYVDEDGEEESEEYSHVAEDSVFTLVPMTEEHAAHATQQTGHWLTHSPHVILHRFELGYVPVGDAELIRVTAEDNERRALKGLNTGLLRGMPLLDSDDVTPMLVRGGLTVSHVQYPNPVITCQGIANVLSIGAVPCMRRLYPDSAIRVERARAGAKAMFKSDRLVYVPDFSVALVRWGKNSDIATVLHRGHIIGVAEYRPSLDSVWFKGDCLKSSDRAANKAIRHGHDCLALRLFADEVMVD